MRLSQAQSVAACHCDPQAVADAILKWRKGGGIGVPWIAVESVYSMDGDVAPLADLMMVAEDNDGVLVVDEAHATGVFGEAGRGLSAGLRGDAPLVVLHTCGKAMGASGALVTAPAIIIDYLVNRARSFIYATAPSPLMAAAVRASLRALADEPERRSALQRRVEVARSELAQVGLPISVSQIVPIILGDNARALRLAAQLRARGFDCRAIRPPTVPEGTARLRISPTLNASEMETAGLMRTIGHLIEENQG